MDEKSREQIGWYSWDELNSDDLRKDYLNDGIELEIDGDEKVVRFYVFDKKRFIELYGTLEFKAF